MKMKYVKTMDIEVNVAELIDSIFDYGCNMYEALADQGIDEDILDEIFTKETTPEIKEQLKYEMAKELLSMTLGNK